MREIREKLRFCERGEYFCGEEFAGKTAYPFVLLRDRVSRFADILHIQLIFFEKKVDNRADLFYNKQVA